MLGMNYWSLFVLFLRMKLGEVIWIRDGLLVVFIVKMLEKFIFVRFFRNSESLRLLMLNVMFGFVSDTMRSSR